MKKSITSSSPNNHPEPDTRVVDVSTSAHDSTIGASSRPHSHKPSAEPCFVVEQKDQTDALTTLCSEVHERYQHFCHQARLTLNHAISLGSLLHRAKEQVGHGQWLAFLSRAGVEERSAQLYLRLFKHQEELREKTEISSDLTIVGALRVLRTSKQRPAALPPVSIEPSPEEKGEIEGYKLADGSLIQTHPNDDGQIPFARVQSLLDSIVSQDNKALEKHRRPHETLLFEQRCLIELVRTANRMLSDNAPVTPLSAETFCSALGTLRNTVTTLPGVQQVRVEGGSASAIPNRSVKAGQKRTGVSAYLPAELDPF